MLLFQMYIKAFPLKRNLDDVPPAWKQKDGIGRKVMNYKKNHRETEREDLA